MRRRSCPHAVHGPACPDPSACSTPDAQPAHAVPVDLDHGPDAQPVHAPSGDVVPSTFERHACGPACCPPDVHAVHAPTSVDRLPDRAADWDRIRATQRARTSGPSGPRTAPEPSPGPGAPGKALRARTVAELLAVRPDGRTVDQERAELRPFARGAFRGPQDGPDVDQLAARVLDAGRWHRHTYAYRWPVDQLAPAGPELRAFVDLAEDAELARLGLPAWDRPQSPQDGPGDPGAPGETCPPVLADVTPSVGPLPVHVDPEIPPGIAYLVTPGAARVFDLDDRGDVVRSFDPFALYRRASVVDPWPEDPDPWHVDPWRDVALRAHMAGRDVGRALADAARPPCLTGCHPRALDGIGRHWPSCPNAPEEGRPDGPDSAPDLDRCPTAGRSATPAAGPLDVHPVHASTSPDVDQDQDGPRSGACSRPDGRHCHACRDLTRCACSCHRGGAPVHVDQDGPQDGPRYRAPGTVDPLTGTRAPSAFDQDRPRLAELAGRALGRFARGLDPLVIGRTWTDPLSGPRTAGDVDPGPATPETPQEAPQDGTAGPCCRAAEIRGTDCAEIRADGPRDPVEAAALAMTGPELADALRAPQDGPQEAAPWTDPAPLYVIPPGHRVHWRRGEPWTAPEDEAPPEDDTEPFTAAWRRTTRAAVLTWAMSEPYPGPATTDDQERPQDRAPYDGPLQRPQERPETADQDGPPWTGADLRWMTSDGRRWTAPAGTPWPETPQDQPAAPWRPEHADDCARRPWMDAWAPRNGDDAHLSTRGPACTCQEAPEDVVGEIRAEIDRRMVAAYDRLILGDPDRPSEPLRGLLSGPLQEAPQEAPADVDQEAGPPVHRPGCRAAHYPGTACRTAPQEAPAAAPVPCTCPGGRHAACYQTGCAEACHEAPAGGPQEAPSVCRRWQDVDGDRVTLSCDCNGTGCPHQPRPAAPRGPVLHLGAGRLYVAPIGTEIPHDEPEPCAMAPYADTGPAWRDVGHLVSGGLSFDLDESAGDLAELHHTARTWPRGPVSVSFTVPMPDELAAGLRALVRRSERRAARRARTRSARAMRALHRGAARRRRSLPVWEA